MSSRCNKKVRNDRIRNEYKADKKQSRNRFREHCREFLFLERFFLYIATVDIIRMGRRDRWHIGVWINNNSDTKNLSEMTNRSYNLSSDRSDLECPLRIKYRGCVILRYYVIYDDKMITNRLVHNMPVGIGTRFFHSVPTGILYTDRLVIIC